MHSCRCARYAVIACREVNTCVPAVGGQTTTGVALWMGKKQALYPSGAHQKQRNARMSVVGTSGKGGWCEVINPLSTFFLFFALLFCYAHVLYYTWLTCVQIDSSCLRLSLHSLSLSLSLFLLTRQIIRCFLPTDRRKF